jgi:hypothetical protein
MASARRGRQIGFLAAALYLFYPRSFFVLEQGWTEPFLVFLLALVVFCAARWRAALPFALGLFLASKQYMVLAVPLVAHLPRPAGKAALVKAAAIVAVVVAALTVPFALWNVPAFMRDIVTLQMYQPFRDDALGFLAAFAWVTGLRLPSALAFVAAVVAIVVLRRRCPATPAAFATAIAVVYFAFFAFNKQAFANYYAFVLGALCCAVAAWNYVTEA